MVSSMIENDGGTVMRLKILMLWFVAAMVVVSTPAASDAQSYGDVLPIVTEIAAGVADDEGTFSYRYTAPDEIEAPYLIYVVGTDDDGEPFEWVVAQVTPAFAGLTWTLAGRDMLPGSDFVLEARSADPADEAADETSDEAADVAAGGSDDDSGAADEAGESGDEEAAASADDESSTRGLVGLAIVLAVIAAALVYGIRLTNRPRA